MYKIPASTLFAGKNLVYVPHCHSTNTLAAELSQKTEMPEGSIVITDRQTSGRGQRGNSWEAQPGQNLTFSIILKPGFLEAKNQFQLSQAVSVAIADYISSRTGQSVSIKWPNDILVANQKVCGILIENHLTGERIGQSIAGIGININQQFFNEPKAISLKMITGMEYQLGVEFNLVLERLEVRYLELRSGRIGPLLDHYIKLLYRRNEPGRYSIANETVVGTITGVNEDGKLRMQVDNAERTFAAKEISYLD